jgi:hypothetical protein
MPFYRHQNLNIVLPMARRQNRLCQRLAIWLMPKEGSSNFQGFNSPRSKARVTASVRSTASSFTSMARICALTV